MVHSKLKLEKSYFYQGVVCRCTISKVRSEFVNSQSVYLRFPFSKASHRVRT